MLRHAIFKLQVITKPNGHGQSVANFPNQNPPIWSNHSNRVLPVSPSKLQFGKCDQGLRDKPSPLRPNRKVDFVSHQSLDTEDSGSKVDMENGILTPCDYQRPIRHLQAVAELPENEREIHFSNLQKKKKLRGKGAAEMSIIGDREELDRLNRLSFPRSPLVAPLGIPYCSASVGEEPTLDHFQRLKRIEIS